MNRQRRRPVAPDAAERLPSLSAFCAALPPEVAPCAGPRLAWPADLYTVLLELAKAGRSAAVHYAPSPGCYYFLASKCSQDSPAGYQIGTQGALDGTAGSRVPNLLLVPSLGNLDHHRPGCGDASLIAQESVGTPAASFACVGRSCSGPAPASDGARCTTAALHASCNGLPAADGVVVSCSASHVGGTEASMDGQNSGAAPKTSGAVADERSRTAMGKTPLPCLDEQQGAGQRLPDGVEAQSPDGNCVHMSSVERTTDGQPARACFVQEAAVEAETGPVMSEQLRTPTCGVTCPADGAVQKGAFLANGREGAGPKDGVEVVVVISTSCQGLTPRLLNTIAVELASEGGSVVLAFVDSDGTTAFNRMYRGIVPPEEGTFDEALVEVDKKRKRRKQDGVGHSPDV